MNNKTNRFLRTLEEYITVVLSFIIGLFYRSQVFHADIKRVAVIKLDHIGDVILSIPAITNLGENFPDAHITMVVNPVSEQIARLIPHIDEVICYNARFFDRTGETKVFDVMKAFRFAKDMKSRNFDLIIDLRGSFASLLFALIAKSRYRLDRGTYLICRKLTFPFSKGGSRGIFKKNDQWTLKHEAEISLDILKKAGITIKTKRSSLDLSRTFNDSIEYPDINIVIHPGGPMLLKRWSADRYIELIRQLLQHYSVRIALIGGKDESELVKSIVSASVLPLLGGTRVGDDRIVDLSGKLTLVQLAYLFKKADLFIGNDSGPMHIASACETKVIGLYGPTDPESFGPYGDNCVTLRMEDKCKPCSQDKCKFKDYRCIDRISVEDVMNVVSEMLLI
jgi:ADP-heptose:LPS heptosyltransferase